MATLADPITAVVASPCNAAAAISPNSAAASPSDQSSSPSLSSDATPASPISTAKQAAAGAAAPIGDTTIIGDWERAVLERYPPDPTATTIAVAPPCLPDPSSIAHETRDVVAYRDYTEEVDAATGMEVDPVKERVRTFYRTNHTHQTYDFATRRRDDFLQFNRRELPVWEAFEFLNQLVDDSDPDTDLDQFQHLLQTSEAIRKDGHPDWMVLVGLIHDLGKVLCLFGEEQWAVVGDTFPVGCAFSDKIIYSEYFAGLNPDAGDARYKSLHGVYSPHCGLRNVTMSWGHDEYIYHIVKKCYADEAAAREAKGSGDDGAADRPPLEQIPEEGLYMLRYHSFYAWHKEGQYGHLMDAHDAAMLPFVKLFNPYDLYSKCAVKPDWAALKPYYEDLVQRYLPKTFKF